MSDRKVTVRVDVSATGNLGTVLKQHAVDAQKLKSAVGAPVNLSSAVVRPTQAMPGATDDAGIRAQIAAGQERAAQRRQQQFIRQQFAQVPVDYHVQAATARESLGQIATQRAGLGTAPHMAALAAQDTQQEQSAILASETKRFASQFKLADLKTSGGRADEVAVIQAEIKARWANAAAAREESKIRNTVEYGRVGGALATFGGRIEKAGMIASVGFAAMTGAVAAASPAAFQTLTGSIQLAVGELGIAFIPTIIQVSGYFQKLAPIIRSINEATDGWIGKIVGGGLAIGALGFAISKAGLFLLPLFSLGKWITGFALAGTGASAGVNSLGSAATRAALALGLVKPAMDMSLLSGGASGGIAASAMGWVSNVLGRIGPALTIFAAGKLAQLAIGGEPGTAQSGFGGAVGQLATGTAIGYAMGGPVGAALGAALYPFLNDVFGGGELNQWVVQQGQLGGGGASGLAAGMPGAAAATAISANFQGQAMGLGDVGQVAQHEAIRDQLQQQIFDLQTRGLEATVALTNALNANTAALESPELAAAGGLGAAIAAWQVNN